MAKFAKILFFIKSFAPTAEELLEANRIPAHVVFRNASKVEPNESLEAADGVHGAVPECYSKYPSAREAIEAHQSALLKANSKLDEEAAPTLSKARPSKVFRQGESS